MNPSPVRPPRPSIRAEQAPAASRFGRLDALRGIALVWMAFFHFCFDLSHYGVIEANFYRDPVWTWQRTLILSGFLLCAGAGQAIATAQGQTWPRFWKRWAQVAGCALAVSASSALMFPDSFIYFGVLHGMAVMLVIARLSAPLGRWLWLLGAVAVALPQFVQHPWFDTRWTNWVGLVTAKPITEDYVPVLPWLGVMWWGLAATQWLLARHPRWLVGATGAPAQGLALLGRWSLTFYMVHQPLLIGGLVLWLQFWRTPS